MLAWPLMLGGLVVWGVHFAGVYGIASVFALFGSAESLGSRLTTAGFTGVCLLANVALLLLAVRLIRRTDDEIRRWRHMIAALGAAFSFVAVFWQGLPALFLG